MAELRQNTRLWCWCSESKILRPVSRPTVISNFFFWNP
jgi:hypothetical protein